MPLMDANIDHPRSVELKSISKILDEHPSINEMVLQDLTHGAKKQGYWSRGNEPGTSLRAAFVNQWERCTYQDLAFHIMDSRSYRNFSRIGIADKGFKKSGLCKNTKAISPETWESVNRVLVSYGQERKVEKGRESCTDCTVVSSDVHEPHDSILLRDSVRVLTRMLNQSKEQIEGFKVQFTDEYHQ